MDRISGDPAPKAWIATTKTTYTRTGTPWPAVIALTCFQKRPIIRFIFEYKIGSNKNSTVAYRFDDKPGRDAEATILPDYKTIVIDDKAEVARFMDELASSNVLLVRVNSLFAGRSTAEFRVQGAPPAIEAITAGCLLPSASKRAASRVRRIVRTWLSLPSHSGPHQTTSILASRRVLAAWRADGIRKEKVEPLPSSLSNQI